MNPNSKKTLKAAAIAAGLVAVLLPTGCSCMSGGAPGQADVALPAPASTHTVVAPHTVD
jgi:hypothetical protein